MGGLPDDWPLDLEFRSEINIRGTKGHQRRINLARALRQSNRIRKLAPYSLRCALTRMAGEAVALRMKELLIS
jgi:hypothetical protein